ncbi:alpha/beta fold hydrolase [Paracoccus marinus]|uniref:alpha/beta fold hydrolase n=1 Tax=Paracoccus marinus TaxID=288426 RepID=UPI00103D8E2F|nr:alpha/beta fold hydrolase [Paracoccus marinus]GLS81900.1 esterase [Paracoccus marinus]
MKLHTTAAGPEEPSDKTPVLLVHGLFGQARNLGVLARALSRDRKVVSVDMRNHGLSPHDPDHSYPAMAGDLAQVIRDHGGRMDVVGHSMGGKAAMWLALTEGELVRRLVVLDIAPVAYSHSQMKQIDAMEGTEFTACKTRSAADAALSARVADPGVRAFLLQSLDLSATPPEWRLNLPVLRARMADLTGWPGSEGKSWNGPALFLAGALSDYVLPEYEAAIFAAFPEARLERVAGTGHWLHAEKPGEVVEAVVGFLG